VHLHALGRYAVLQLLGLVLLLSVPGVLHQVLLPIRDDEVEDDAQEAADGEARAQHNDDRVAEPCMSQKKTLRKRFTAPVIRNDALDALSIALASTRAMPKTSERTRKKPSARVCRLHLYKRAQSDPRMYERNTRTCFNTEQEL
jgi:hypothetical protein